MVGREILSRAATDTRFDRILCLAPARSIRRHPRRPGPIAYFMPEIGPNGDFWIVPSGGGTPRQLTRDLTGRIDVTFDVARTGEVIWSDYVEGRHELWQATLRQ